MAAKKEEPKKLSQAEIDEIERVEKARLKAQEAQENKELEELAAREQKQVPAKAQTSGTTGQNKPMPDLEPPAPIPHDQIYGVGAGVSPQQRQEAEAQWAKDREEHKRRVESGESLQAESEK